MFKREALIIAAEVIVQLLSKCLRVIEKLQCREVWCRRDTVVVLFLKEIFGGEVNPGKSCIDRYLLCSVELFLKLFVASPSLFVDFATMMKGSDVGTLEGDG